MSRKFVAAIVALFLAFSVGNARAEQTTWSFVLRPNDIVAGSSLAKLKTRHHWNGTFNEQFGTFEIAVRKAAFPAEAPQCRADYLILAMPAYYPENPKQSPMAERRAVYDSLLSMQEKKSGRLPVRVEALSYMRNGPHGPELTTCNIYFVLPLATDAGKLVP